MNRLSFEKRADVVRTLIEGNSVQVTARATDTAKASVLKLLLRLGESCSRYQHVRLVGLPCKRIEVQEVWTLAAASTKNPVKDERDDIWTYTAICADSKLMVSWFVGEQSNDCAFEFMQDVASRLSDHAQLTTDSASSLVAAVTKPTIRPDIEKMDSSISARQNFKRWMPPRRFSRLTDALSKRIENHAKAFSLFVMSYNYCRPDPGLTNSARGVATTPAMVAGISDHVWSVEEILELAGSGEIAILS